MARYLVTGGAGFIGSHVVDALAARGDAVRVVDDLSTGCRDNLAAHPEIELLEADLAERRVAEAAVAGVDCAIHLAAIPSVPRSVREPHRSHRANVEATHELLHAAREAGVRRVVLASSSSVYGESETLPKHEGLRPAPLSPYALHKLIGEQYAALFSRLYGLETVALRFFNVFGPRQSPLSQYSGVISLFTAALLEGRAPTIPRGRRADARLHLRHRRRPRRPAGLLRAGGLGTGRQRRARGAMVGQRAVRGAAAGDRGLRRGALRGVSSRRRPALAGGRVAGPRAPGPCPGRGGREGAPAHRGVAACAGGRRARPGSGPCRRRRVKSLPASGASSGRSQPDGLRAEPACPSACVSAPACRTDRTSPSAPTTSTARPVAMGAASPARARQSSPPMRT